MSPQSQAQESSQIVALSLQGSAFEQLPFCRLDCFYGLKLSLTQSCVRPQSSPMWWCNTLKRESSSAVIACRWGHKFPDSYINFRVSPNHVTVLFSISNICAVLDSETLCQCEFTVELSDTEFAAEILPTRPLGTALAAFFFVSQNRPLSPRGRTDDFQDGDNLARWLSTSSSKLNYVAAIAAFWGLFLWLKSEYTIHLDCVRFSFARDFVKLM